MFSFCVVIFPDLLIFSAFRDRIKQGLIKLKMKIPQGNTYLHLGLEKVFVLSIFLLIFEQFFLSNRLGNLYIRHN